MEEVVEGLVSHFEATKQEMLYEGMVFGQELVRKRFGSLADRMEVKMDDEEVCIECEDWLLDKYEGDLEYVVAQIKDHMEDYFEDKF